MRSLCLILATIALSSAGTDYTCGERKMVKRPYGAVELRVRCDYKSENRISVLEYKGNVQHGFQMGYDSLWRKRDSTFFKNGKAEGTRLYWDSLGNVIGRETLRGGIFVGKRELFFSANKPSLIKNYNAAGREDGEWKEWWENGNRRAELIAKDGEIIAGEEFYQDGKPRIRYRSKYDPQNKSALKIKRIEGESWDPSGKQAGKIDNGNGDWIIFPDGKSGTSSVAVHEFYKDSLLIKSEPLDPGEITK